MSKGYEKFKRVDRELDALLLYLQKLEEDYARAKSELNKNWFYKKAVLKYFTSILIV
jgi:hypothetical protein